MHPLLKAGWVTDGAVSGDRQRFYTTFSLPDNLNCLYQQCCSVCAFCFFWYDLPCTDKPLAVVVTIEGARKKFVCFFHEGAGFVSWETNLPSDWNVNSFSGEQTGKMWIERISMVWKQFCFFFVNYCLYQNQSICMSWKVLNTMNFLKKVLISIHESLKHFHLAAVGTNVSYKMLLCLIAGCREMLCTFLTKSEILATVDCFCAGGCSAANTTSYSS